MNQEILDFLKAVHKMSLEEDWSECRAQALIIRGGEIYQNYLKQQEK